MHANDQLCLLHMPIAAHTCPLLHIHTHAFCHTQIPRGTPDHQLLCTLQAHVQSQLQTLPHICMPVHRELSMVVAVCVYKPNLKQQSGHTCLLDQGAESLLLCHCP